MGKRYHTTSDLTPPTQPICWPPSTCPSSPQVWLRLNTVYPRQLWLLTVNHLTPPPTITQVLSSTSPSLQSSLNPPSLQEDLALDPLAVLRCDDRVFRCGPLLAVVLYMLKACLVASRSRLAQYLQVQNSTLSTYRYRIVHTVHTGTE